jgi:hypothetical protein
MEMYCVCENDIEFSGITTLRYTTSNVYIFYNPRSNFGRIEIHSAAVKIKFIFIIKYLNLLHILLTIN